MVVCSDDDDVEHLLLLRQITARFPKSAERARALAVVSVVAIE